MTKQIHFNYEEDLTDHNKKQICTKCSKEKHVSLYYKRTDRNKGYSTICKKCTVKPKNKNLNTKEDIILKSFRSQKYNSKRNGKGELNYGLEDIKTLVLKNPKFHLLYDEWQKSNFETNLRPIIFRKNKKLNFTLNNIEVGLYRNRFKDVKRDLISVEEYKTRFRKAHKDRYDYSLFCKKAKSMDLIEVICKEHGVFDIKPYNHEKGRGCPWCAKRGRSEKIASKVITGSLKECEMCKEEKSTELFYKNNSKNGGFHTICKNCTKVKRKENYKEKAKTEKISIKEKVCPKCKENKPSKKYQKSSSNKHGLSRICKKCIAVSKRKSYSKNRSKLIKRGYELKKKRLKNDPLFKLKEGVSSLIRNSFKNKLFTKRTKTAKILGVDFKNFKNHLEDNPYNFKVGDEGLDLDHIIPLSSANTEEKLLELNHYTNFQLLPKKYNRWVKRENEWDKEHFEEWLKKQSINGI